MTISQYTLTFFDRDNNEVAKLQNVSDKIFTKLNGEEFTFDQKIEDELIIEEHEIIKAIKVGLSKPCKNLCYR